MGVNVREAALNSIIRCEKESRYSNLEIDSAIERYKLEGLDRSFFTALVYGVIERKITLDYHISLYSKYRPDELDIFVLNILRLGAYQILYMDRTPDHAAVNEAVEMARRRCKPAVVGLVNAVLREIARNKDTFRLPDDEIKRKSVTHSLPEWMCELFTDCYGSKADDIMLGLNRKPGLYVRVNTLKISREDYIRVLRDDGIPASPCDCCMSAVLIEKDLPVYLLHLDDGLARVQDLSSQICVEKAGAAPGFTVIDTCACPGGKSFGMAIDMNNTGRLISLDLHKNKLSLIERGAVELGIDIIETAECNGQKGCPDYDGTADLVLCDVPCSGLGVIAKKPDIRYKKHEDIAQLPAVQNAILERSCSYVKNGGKLMYSTCTVNPAENEDVTDGFLASHPEFSVVDSAQLYPSEAYDGFFYCLMQNNK